MIIVLDTNIWLSELALNSAAGSALRFFIKHRGDRLAIPEVVRLEVRHNLRRVILDAMEDTRRGHRQLLALFGSMKELVLPTEVEVDTLIERVLGQVGVSTIDVPFVLESARASFMKTISKTSPSDRTQEFKDGVLWADCITLLDQDDVLLATADRAFYADRNYERGLASSLAKEVASSAHQLSLVPSVSEVLEQVGSEMSFDTAWLARALADEVRSSAATLLSRNGVALGDESQATWTLFATENPDTLYATHEVTATGEDIAGEDRTEVALIATGHATLCLHPLELLGVQPGEERLSFKDDQGRAHESRSVCGSVHMVAGHKTVAHEVRHRLR